MKKFLLLILVVLIPSMSYSQKKTSKKTKRKVYNKKTSPNGLTPGQLELIKFRQENPVFFKNHIEGLNSSTASTGVNYSNFNGKDCSEIAKKENWGNWNPPDNADEKCAKYLKNKKLKKILLYPLK